MSEHTQKQNSIRATAKAGRLVAKSKPSPFVRAGGETLAIRTNQGVLSNRKALPKSKGPGAQKWINVASAITTGLVPLPIRVEAEDMDKVLAAITGFLDLAGIRYEAPTAQTEQDGDHAALAALCAEPIDMEGAQEASEVFDLSPGSVLQSCRKVAELTQGELADKIEGLTQSRVSEMESGKVPISRNMAERLATALNTVPDVFLAD